MHWEPLNATYSRPADKRNTNGKIFLAKEVHHQVAVLQSSKTINCQSKTMNSSPMLPSHATADSIIVFLPEVSVSEVNFGIVLVSQSNDYISEEW